MLKNARKDYVEMFVGNVRHKFWNMIEKEARRDEICSKKNFIHFHYGNIVLNKGRSKYIQDHYKISYSQIFLNCISIFLKNLSLTWTKDKKKITSRDKKLPLNLNWTERISQDSNQKKFRYCHKTLCIVASYIQNNFTCMYVHPK